MKLLLARSTVELNRIVKLLDRGRLGAVLALLLALWRRRLAHVPAFGFNWQQGTGDGGN